MSFMIVSKMPGKAPVVVVCIEERNVKAMKEGKPMFLKIEDNGFADVAIVYGQTLRDAIAYLRTSGVPLPPDLEEKADAISGISPSPPGKQ